MYRNRLLVIALALIGTGMAGVFIAAWFGGPHVFVGSMSSGSGMIRMMGGGMMDRERMKEMMEEMMSGRLPPDIEPEDLPEPDSEGAQLLVRYCSQCHNLPSPLMHTAEEWLPAMERMVSRMEMMRERRGGMGGMMMRGMMDVESPSKSEQKTLLAYLQRHALKPASEETLGPPGAPGLTLFRQACSQCHALPDPKLHSADEWPGVVERMRKNMEIMGKPGITAQQRDEIVGYLGQHAR